MITRTLLAATVTAELLLAQSNRLQNGDFENGPPIPGNQTELTVTGAELPGWFIPLGNCDYNSPFWSPSSGNRSLDLHGVARGAIEQTIATQPGDNYEVVFDLGAAGPQSCRVSAAGLTSQLFSHAGGQFPNVTYALDRRWSFVANHSTATIRFDSASLPTDANGPHIDNVRVFRTSWPASFRTFGNGCAGSAGTPVLDALPGSRPVLGHAFTVELRNLSSSLADAAFLLIGVEAATSPIQLDSIGMPGCALYIQPLDAAALLKFAGTARWRVVIPQDPAIVGGLVTLQGLAFERFPTPNPLGAVTSNAAEALIGTL